MTTNKTAKFQILTPAEGMTLTNGETYSKLVYLPLTADPTAWREVADADVPVEPTSVGEETVVTDTEDKPRHFTQLKMIVAFEKRELWVRVRAWLDSNNLLDKFFAAQFLAEDDPMFSTAISLLKSAFNWSDEELNQFLSECEDD